MTLLEAAAVVLAGLAAGTINAVVGSGSLITFPTLLAVGLPPVTANVSNTVGLVPGAVTGAVGYRAELAGQRARLVRLGSATVLGALAGAALLLVLPPSVFATVVPVLIVLACLLVAVQPWLVHRLRDRPRHAHGGLVAWLLVLATGVYGGYFGAAQGIMLIAALGVTLDEGLQRVNAAKNVLAGLANLVSGAVFVVVAPVDWRAAVLVAVGATLGGWVGARVGRRLPPAVLRGVVVLVGLAALFALR
ncbi:MAG TPA: sulfite exporter TauE/SafE family protein [Jiangellales bacterium]|nr:sulfite exporter TauE/SafE family protein [Jiangellales bacterium]